MNIPLSSSLMIVYLSITSSLSTSQVVKQDLADSIQTKRDLSLSYAATDIGSKEGTHVKTITVIKNVNGKKQQPLKINPKEHKNEEWGSYFRDNFDAYGVIPDVPDIDDLFEFVNKKDDKKPKEKNIPKKENDEGGKKDMIDGGESKNENKTTTSPPLPVEEVSKESSSDENVEKITGDAELIQSGGKPNKVKSQSLDLGKYRVQESNTFDVSYSTPHSLDRQFFPSSDTRGNKNEKYIQSPSDSYYYPQPGFGNTNALPVDNTNALPVDNSNSPQPQAGRGSISVTTPSGRKYDIPFGNATDIPPYIAPNFRSNQNSPPASQNIATSSQRPYIAPNVRKNYDAHVRNVSPYPLGNTQQPPNNVYTNIPASFRTGSYKPNLPRSRGLRY